MTRKHYRDVSGAIYREYVNATSEETRLSLRNVAHHLAGAFKQDNERFDAAKFYEACGMGQTGTK